MGGGLAGEFKRTGLRQKQLKDEQELVVENLDALTRRRTRAS